MDEWTNIWMDNGWMDGEILSVNDTFQKRRWSLGDVRKYC